MKLDIRLDRSDIAEAISRWLENKQSILIPPSLIKFRTTENSSNEFATTIEAFVNSK